jgi:hypothetical protein
MAAKQPFRLQKAGTDSWSTIALGRSNFHMAMLLTPSRQVVGLETIIAGPFYEAWYQFLESKRDSLESELGMELQWVPKRGQKSARVFIESPVNTKDDNQRQVAIDWFCEWTPKWYAAFTAYTKLLPNSEFTE